MVWMFAPLLALPLVISAFWWMGAPTKRGRAVMDRIAGFEQYLSITEEDRFETLHPPEKTPELFERYLPLCDRARRREQLGVALRRRAGGGRGRPQPAGRPYGLVFRIEQPVDQCQRLHRRGRRDPGEQRRLGLDRAGIEQRLGRRRFLGRRRRRRRRWRLVGFFCCSRPALSRRGGGPLGAGSGRPLDPPLHQRRHHRRPLPGRGRVGDRRHRSDPRRVRSSTPLLQRSRMQHRRSRHAGGQPAGLRQCRDHRL